MKENKIKVGNTISTNINDEININPYLLNIEKRANYLINEHYKKIGTTYNYLILDNLLSNGKCHIVALFKEYLIVDDCSEVFKRYYKKKESLPRIKKVSQYYYETSVIFPNYTPLIEAKYFYKNIMRKQKVIDQIQELEERERYNKMARKKKEKEKNNNNDNVFNDTAYNEILNQSESVLRIVFGLKKEKLNIFSDNEENNSDNKGIQNIINEISKYENNKLQISSNSLTKNNKIKIGIPNLKNKPKLSFQNGSNLKTILDYKNKSNILNTVSLRTFSPNTTNYNTINNNSTSRNLKVNMTLLNNNSINSNRQVNHKSTFSMPKINISSSKDKKNISKDKKIKLLSFNSIDNNNNLNNYSNNNFIKNKNVIKNVELKTFFMSNLVSPSNNKKMHKKIRSVIGRNNGNDLYKTFHKNFNTSGNIDKDRKNFHIKQPEINGKKKIKPSLFLHEEFFGFYTERNKK